MCQFQEAATQPHWGGTLVTITPSCLPYDAQCPFTRACENQASHIHPQSLSAWIHPGLICDSWDITVRIQYCIRLCCCLLLSWHVSFVLPNISQPPENRCKLVHLFVGESDFDSKMTFIHGLCHSPDFLLTSNPLAQTADRKILLVGEIP